jgi:hypothetical protein
MLVTERGALFLLALGSTTCSADERAAGNKPFGCGSAGVVRQPIINGGADDVFLGLSTSQKRAVVMIEGRTAEASGVCSGTLVAPHWILTAGHCLAMVEPVASIETAIGRVSIRVEQAVPHPTLEAALMRIDDEADCVNAEPIALNALPPDATWIDRRVELAGYGLSESDTIGELRFAVEVIVAIEPSELIVDGGGRSGACAGDSGGPMLIRAEDGAPQLLGVLSSGSSSCVTKDRFVRADLMAGWVGTVTGQALARSRDCGQLTTEGSCAWGSAIWCSEGVLQHSSCTSGLHCGWDQRARGFRCVEPAQDPCEGVGPQGLCEGHEALRCVSGTLERMSCSLQGQRCAYLPASGLPSCITEP